MQLRKRCPVKGRYRYISRLSPSTPFNPRLILTKRRKEMITTFKNLYPLGFRGLHRPNSEVWARELRTFLFHHDDKIQLEDVMKWIKNHSWITHVAEEEEPPAPLVTASPEPASMNCRWMRSRNPMPSMPTQNVSNRNGPSAFRPTGFRPIDPALATGKRNRNKVKKTKKNIRSGPSTSQRAKRKYPTEEIVPGSSNDVASAKTKKSSVPNSFRRGRVENHNIQHHESNMPVLNPVSSIPSDIGDNESGVYTGNEDRQQSRSEDMDRVVSPDISVTTPSPGPTSRHVILDQQAEANSRRNKRQRKISADYARAFDSIRELIDFCQGRPSLRSGLGLLKKVAQALSRSNLDFMTRKIRRGPSAEAIAGANARIKDEVEGDDEDADEDADAGEDEDDEIDIGNQQSPILFISDSMLPII